MEPCPIIPRKITKKKTFTYLQYYSVLVPWSPGTVPVACKKRKVGLNGWVVKRRGKVVKKEIHLSLRRREAKEATKKEGKGRTHCFR